MSKELQPLFLNTPILERTAADGITDFEYTLLKLVLDAAVPRGISILDAFGVVDMMREAGQMMIERIEARK